MRIQELEDKVDNLEQFTRRNSVRINGIAELDGEDCHKIVSDLVTDSLDLPLNPWEIIGCHRVGPAPKKGQSSSVYPCSIIAKFISHHKKNEVIRDRRKLKSARPDTYINEDLTKTRANLHRLARQLKKKKVIDQCWTFDGKLFLKDFNNHVDILDNAIKLIALYPDVLQYA